MEADWQRSFSRQHTGRSPCAKLSSPPLAGRHTPSAVDPSIVTLESERVRMTVGEAELETGLESELETTFAAELRRFAAAGAADAGGAGGRLGVSARTIGGLERGHSLGPQRRTVMGARRRTGPGRSRAGCLEQLAEVGRPRPVTAPAGWCVPPRAVADFTGREDELVRLAALAAGSGPAASVVVLSGPGGVGKTTLAVAGRAAGGGRGRARLLLRRPARSGRRSRWIRPRRCSAC